MIDLPCVHSAGLSQKADDNKASAHPWALNHTPAESDSDLMVQRQSNSYCVKCNYNGEKIRSKCDPHKHKVKILGAISSPSKMLLLDVSTQHMDSALKNEASL